MSITRSSQKSCDVIVQWILVLFEPAFRRVLNLCGVMSQHETLAQPRWAIFSSLAIPERIKFLGERFVGSFWHDTVFVETGKYTDGVGELDKVYRWLKIVAKVYEFPLNLLSRIFFLFENEHVMVEELLKLLVRIIDA